MSNMCRKNPWDFRKIDQSGLIIHRPEKPAYLETKISPAKDKVKFPFKHTPENILFLEKLDFNLFNIRKKNYIKMHYLKYNGKIFFLFIYCIYTS